METQSIADIGIKQNPFSPGLMKYQNKATKALYRRVVGALAWPRDIRPGALVVLVEHQEPMSGLDMRKVEIAAEYTHDDPDQLLRRASLWSEVLSCRAWMTPVSAPEMRLVTDYNDGRRRLRLPQLDLALPPSVNGSRDWAAYDRLFERRTRGVKTLFFGEGSMVAREYKSRQRAELSRSLELYPLLAAFLWALASIDLDSPVTAMGQGITRQTSNGPADDIGGY
ncbi:MAG: hypothetical protein Q7U56_14020 [Humidesulfovibrio sp.]|nr:hypothetical protein [Humidesulfovibrio sp.]